MFLQIFLQIETPTEFLTSDSIKSFAGASTAVWILSNLTRVLLKKSPLILCFIFSLIVSYLSISTWGTLEEGVDYFMAFLNATLLFFTSIGVQGFSSAAAQGQLPQVTAHSGGKVSFFTPWL